jgi:glycosyltransferase involved in cell wall biosynthesis
MFTQKTSLIIPTRNRPLLLLKLFKNLKNFKIKFKEILVIDSSNKEIKIEINNIVKSFNCKLYHSKPSTSLQRNIGLKNKDKKSKYVMFLDDDIIFKKNSFLSLNNKIIFHEKNKSKILGYGFNQKKKTKKSLLENIKKSKIAKIFGLYSKKDGIVMSSGWQTKILNISDDTLTEWIPTGAVVFPSNVLNIKFNENFGKYSYLEDLDFSLNLRKKNYMNKFLIVASAIFFHPNDIERINFNFGLIEILNRFLIVRKYRLNIFYFFYMSFIKSLMTLFMSLRNIKNIMKFFGNIFAILVCFKRLIFY